MSQTAKVEEQEGLPGCRSNRHTHKRRNEESLVHPKNGASPMAVAGQGRAETGPHHHEFTMPKSGIWMLIFKDRGTVTYTIQRRGMDR